MGMWKHSALVGSTVVWVQVLMAMAMAMKRERVMRYALAGREADSAGLQLQAIPYFE
jgi:hypothetical protein